MNCQVVTHVLQQHVRGCTEQQGHGTLQQYSLGDGVCELAAGASATASMASASSVAAAEVVEAMKVAQRK